MLRRIVAFESGDAAPTLRQLDPLAHLYDVPRWVFVFMTSKYPGWSYVRVRPIRWCGFDAGGAGCTEMGRPTDAFGGKKDIPGIRREPVRTGGQSSPVEPELAVRIREDSGFSLTGVREDAQTRLRSNDGSRKMPTTTTRYRVW